MTFHTVPRTADIGVRRILGSPGSDADRGTDAHRLVDERKMKVLNGILGTEMTVFEFLGCLFLTAVLVATARAVTTLCVRAVRSITKGMA